MKIMTSDVCILKLVGAIFVLLQFGLLLSNYYGAVVDAKHVASVSGGCIEKERHALLELKASLVLDDANLLSTWDSKSECCAWKEVGCSNQTGHVEKLHLNGFQFGPFRGKINTSLMELRHLKYLNLGWSTFSNNDFPELFGSLSNLRLLDLQSSFYGGRIPNDLSRLSHLQYLDLSQNSLEGTIPHQLGNLSHLQHLDLSWNNLVGTIPYQLGSLSNLQQLHLGDNRGLKVHDKNNDVGGEWLSNLTLLTHLDLSGLTNLNSSHVWLQMIGKLPKIEELKLSQCHLSDLSHSHSKNEQQGGIFESLGDLCTLHLLYLNVNNLNEAISTILLNLSGCARYSLQYLSLHDNQITGTLPNLSIFPSLITIDLSSNMLSGKVPQGIPKSLESFVLSSNSLEGGIPKSFGNLCSLRSLDLSSNKLSEDLSVMLHNLSVGCAKYSLQELDLGNQIIGTIPDMSGFSSLEHLVLSDNLLNGKIIQMSPFPYKLESLYLDSNNLKGVITDSHFGNMSRLGSLNLSSNSLALIFSENWVPPFQLTYTLLRSCNLGPNFPKWLRNQKHIQELDISDARISDVVPVWFWTQATNIRFMNISYNNLTGTIPNLPMIFSEDCELILESNQFNGSIPVFFRSATLLQLSKNKFLETHLFLCANTTVDRLFILDLSKNQLSRQLPDCWSHLKALKFLDFSDNTLSGEVPSSMGSLHKLKVLILRNNSLTGQLPVSLKNCSKLIMLDLGDNRFSGPIPYWLGQQLQMLSLRGNQLSGSLPLSLCDLTNIQLLDLSENNLSGLIFKCWKNFSAMSQNVFSTTQNVITMFEDIFSPGYEGYDLFALMMWKGTERLFKNDKLILRSIDLSSNQLTGDLPEEIGNLIALVSLNLSSNNLTGEITSMIGKLTSLEFLDLSRNHFTGLIPHSLTQIDRLSMLNLSNNNLSGRIPIGTQLQSFDASSYEGNADLCGKPLDKKCPRDEVAPQKPETHEESSQEDKRPIYLSVALGFITGFWGLWGSLFLSRNWRHTYVLFLNYIIDTVYVFMVLNVNKFQRRLRGFLEKFV